MNNRLFEIDHILDNKNPVSPYKFCAIYFLIRKNKIMYIGSATNLGTRLLTHSKNQRLKHDSFYYIRYSDDDKELMRYDEFLYIRKYAPKFNWQYNPKVTDTKMALFHAYLHRYKNMNELADAVGIFQPALSIFFDLNKESNEVHQQILMNHFFPDGIKVKPPQIKKLRESVATRL